MPANYTIETAYLGPFSSIDQVNSATLYKPGELGLRVDTGNKQYQLVQLDSGVLANATQGQVVYWKSQQPFNYVVTNNNLFAGGTSAARNWIAGIITPTAGVTAGYYTYIQQQGQCTFIKTDSVTGAVGDWLIGSATTGNSTNATATLGTAPPTEVVAVIDTASSGAATTQSGYLQITGAV
jgi:hypothetical protein